jgi:hypothetical protein
MSKVYLLESLVLADLKQILEPKAHGQHRGKDLADFSPNPGTSSVSSINAGTNVEKNYVHSQICDSCEEVTLSSHLALYNDSDICPALLLDHRWCQIPMFERSVQTDVLIPPSSLRGYLEYHTVSGQSVRTKR